MAQETIKPAVALSENQRITYEKRSWFIFSWYAKVKLESLGKDLVIQVPEEFDKIFVNGGEVNWKK